MPEHPPVTMRIPVERHGPAKAVTVQMATPAAAVPAPDAAHDCRTYLPRLQTVRRARRIEGQRYPRNTVGLCPVCTRPWRVVTGKQYGVKTFTWLPLRPWNVAARDVHAGLILDLLRTAK